jgi:hypothetical protein
MGLFDFLGSGDHGAGKYGGMADDYQHRADVATGAVGGQISQYGDIASGGQSLYDRYDPQYTGAVDTRVAQLQRNNHTTQARDSYLANRIGPTTAAYQATRANMATSAYQRGLDTPGSAGASSVTAGNNAYLDNAQLGRLNAANDSYADYADAKDASNANDLISLLGGVRSEGLNQWTGGLGSEAQGNEWMAGQYGNTAGQYRGLQQQAEAQQQQDGNGLLGLIGGVADLYGAGAFGGGAKKAISTTDRPSAGAFQFSF